MVEDQELSSPFQGEFEIKTFKSDAPFIAAPFHNWKHSGQLSRWLPCNGKGFVKKRRQIAQDPNSKAEALHAVI